MMRSQGNNTVQAFPPERAQESFAERIGLRGLGRRFQHPQPEMADTLITLLGENAVPVMEKDAVRVVSRERCAELLQCPLGGGVHGDIALQDAAGGVLHDHKHGEETKRRSDYQGYVRDPCLCRYGHKHVYAARHIMSIRARTIAKK